MADDLPMVGRPHGSTARRLQSEGIIWEGQVLISGEEIDLAALLIVTSQRLAFIRGGSIALDIEHSWLHPAPVLRRTGSILLWVAAPGAPESDTIALFARSGRRDAAQLVSLLTQETQSWATHPDISILPLDAGQPVSPFSFARSNEFEFVEEESAMENGDIEDIPLFSVLDSDDFPPVEPRQIKSGAWTESVDLESELTGPVALSASIRNPDDPLQPIPGMDSRDSRDRRSWVIRLGGLMVLFAMISGMGSGLIPGWGEVKDFAYPPEPSVVAVAEVAYPTSTPATLDPTRVPTEVAAPTETAPTEVAPELSTTSSAPQTSDPQAPTVVPRETALALGVGAGNPPDVEESELSSEPTETLPPTIVPSPTTEPTATATPTSKPTETRVPPTQTQEPVISSSLELQVEESPTPEPTIDTTPVIPVPVPTDTEVEPTSEPSEPSPTDPAESSTTPEAATPETDEPSVDSDSATVVTNQPNTLEGGEVPRQTFVTNGLRVAIDSVSQAPSIPELTLGPAGDGEWVVLEVSAENWSASVVELRLASLILAPADDITSEIPLNDATSAVASFQGYAPALGPNDVATIAPGATQEFALVFIVPAQSGDLALLTDDAVIELSVALANQPQGGELDRTASSSLIPATVVDVLSGTSILVEAAGEQSIIHYVGLEERDTGSCYASESTSANAALVEGQTVFLERERRNRISPDNYLRDVWIADENGTLALVAALLIESGDATPASLAPDIRFSGWLEGESLQAEANAIGIWSACSN